MEKTFHINKGERCKENISANLPQGIDVTFFDDDNTCQIYYTKVDDLIKFKKIRDIKKEKPNRKINGKFHQVNKDEKL